MWRNFARVACPLLRPPLPVCFRLVSLLPPGRLLRTPLWPPPLWPPPLWPPPLWSPTLWQTPLWPPPLWPPPHWPPPLWPRPSNSRPSDRHLSDRRAAPLTAVTRLCLVVFPVAAAWFKLRDKLKTLYCITTIQKMSINVGSVILLCLRDGTGQQPV